MNTIMLRFVRATANGATFAMVACLSFFCPTVQAQTAVLTQRNDVGRTGQNSNETILTPANVSSGKFGKLFPLWVDGAIYAQPLYMQGLTIAGLTHNVVFAATEHDSVYAFDADTFGPPLWHASLLDLAHGAAPGATTDPNSDTGCSDIIPEYGITGTPVIDPLTNTLYVVSVTLENSSAVQRLHALDLTTGLEKFGGPVAIGASIAGTGHGSIAGVITFDPKWQLQRAGLLLVNGTIYLAFGSHCDLGVYHGWLMAYNAATLKQTSAFLTTPNGVEAGIWMSGTGPSADIAAGLPRIFLASGNGTYDASVPYGTNTEDYGDSVLRFDVTKGLAVSDDFTPEDQGQLFAGDGDQGAGGALILPEQAGPDPHLLIQAGKSGRVYLINRDSMGGYTAVGNRVVQELDGQVSGYLGTPAYWNGNVYFWTSGSALAQFSLTNGALSAIPVATGPTTSSSGATSSISSNGPLDGIVWSLDWSTATLILYANDATDVARSLWSSTDNSVRDSAGYSVHFPVPTIANGKVYTGSANQLQVYGLLVGVPDFNVTSSATPVNLDQGAVSNGSLIVTPLNGFTGAVSLTASNLPAGVTISFSPSPLGYPVTAIFTAAINAAPGTYLVSINGVSGGLKHAATIALTVVGVPGFSLTANPPAMTLLQGGVLTSRITVTGRSGFSGSPTFAISGLPPGVTASFSPASSSSGTTLTLSASVTAWVGEYQLSVSGTSNDIVSNVGLPLTVARSVLLSRVQLVNRQSDLCLDVTNISKSAGAPIWQWTCWGGLNQLWNLTLISGNTYQLTSANSGLSIDVAGQVTTVGAGIVQDQYANQKSQQWSVVKTADGYFNLVNVNSALCLDISDVNSGPGAYAMQSTCGTGDSQKWNTVPYSNTTEVNLGAVFSINGIVTDGTPPANQGIDLEGNAFPEAVLGSGFSFNGYSFGVGPANVPDAVSSQTILLPSGQWSSIALVGIGVNGNQPNQTFVVNYTDGMATIFQQSVSDWGSAQNYTGEYLVLTSPYRIKADGTRDARPFNLYGYGTELDSTRTPVSITLPPNRSVVILGVTLK